MSLASSIVFAVNCAMVDTQALDLHKYSRIVTALQNSWMHSLLGPPRNILDVYCQTRPPV